MSSTSQTISKRHFTKVHVIEYVWTDLEGNLRSKARILEYDERRLFNPLTIPRWNYDGSSTRQADGTDSEVIIIPRRAILCPFRRSPGTDNHNLIVLCDSQNHRSDPLESNYRAGAAKIFENKQELRPWFGIEQEFFMRDVRTGLILGFGEENGSKPVTQGQYYCSVGGLNAFGRAVLEDALSNFLYSKLQVSGINAEVAPGQWEYQIGPVTGIDASDQLYLSRYILERTAESHGISIEYHPKPTGYENWNGSGCHTNFSTKPMRDDGGLHVINDAILKLEKKHTEHMEGYGAHNELRMTGIHETADFAKFTYGRADRGASVRIGNHVYDDGKGYFEDRRPSSNMNPYRVTSMIFEACCLDE
jgi:glutamine synthetase